MPDNTSNGLMMSCKAVFHLEEGGRVGKGRDVNGAVVVFQVWSVS